MATGATARLMGDLMEQAEKSALFRGHSLGQWMGDWERGRLWAVCKRCPRQVSIDCDPPPNGIDVGGEAVAVGCED